MRYVKTEVSRRHFDEKAGDIFECDHKFIYELRDPVQWAEEDDFGFIRYVIILDMIDRLRLSGSLLDLGCGSGYLMAKLTQRGFIVSGVDLSRRFLAIAQKKFRYHNLNFRELLEADLQQMLPFSDSQFDLITSSDVIEHLERPERMLSEAHRLLKNGGYLVLSTNNALSIWGLMKLISKKLLRQKEYHPVDNWFTPRRLLEFAHRSGFKVIELRGVYFFPYYRFRSVLQRLGLYRKRTRINEYLSRSIFKYFGRDLVILLRKDARKHSFWYNPHSGVRRNHTLCRIINRAGVELGIKLKSPYAWAWPHHAVIEITNVCNLHCPLCPTGQGVPGRPKGMMKFDAFKKIIDSLGAYLYNVRLENWGEPLLNGEIVSMVEYLKKKGIHSGFNTNLLKLDDITAQKLIIAGLDHIKISFDAVDQETYSRYRVGGNFRILVKNIERLVKKRRVLGRMNPFIELQYLVMKHNEKYIKEARKLAAKLGVDRFTLRPIRIDMKEELFGSDQKSFMRYKNWLPQNPDYSLFNYSTGAKKQKLAICDNLWNSVVINYDGSVVPCCAVYEPKYDFGNFFKEGFTRIWNGPKYRAARKLIGRRKISPIDIVCKFCFEKGVLC